MDRTPIRSTNIKEAGYDAQSRTLEIMFSDGRLYHYFDVPESIFDELRNATSAGQCFHSKIREAFRFKRIA